MFVCVITIGRRAHNRCVDKSALFLSFANLEREIAWALCTLCGISSDVNSVVHIKMTQISAKTGSSCLPQTSTDKNAFALLFRCAVCRCGRGKCTPNNRIDVALQQTNTCPTMSSCIMNINQENSSNEGRLLSRIRSLPQLGNCNSQQLQGECST